MSEIVYIAGPMRGIPRFNFSSFDIARDQLASLGYPVISPADMDRANGFDPDTLPDDWDWSTVPPEFDLDAAMARDLAAIRERADMVVTLEGSNRSEGARREIEVANECGIPVHTLCSLLSSHHRSAINDSGVRNETIVTDPITGGRKATKLARFDLIPHGALLKLAEHYGRGAEKYDDNNWRKGYKWSLSYAALQRHLNAFWRGEQMDELGTPHIIAAAWHCMTLFTFDDEGLGTDDRIKSPNLTTVDVQPLDSYRSFAGTEKR